MDCNPGAEGPTALPPPIATCGATLQDAAVVLELDTLTGADNRAVLNAASNNQEHFVAAFEAWSIRSSEGVSSGGAGESLEGRHFSLTR